MKLIVNESTDLHQEAILIIEKEKEYLNYIEEHIGNVKLAYQTFLVPLLSNEISCNTVSESTLKEAIKLAEQRIQIHDESKYSDEEFKPYRVHHHPTRIELQLDEDTKNENERLYEKAWEHHYRNNDHHPQYWKKEDGSMEDMSLDAIVEMICDWEAMGIKFKSNTIEWWNKAEKEKSFMTDKTKEIVDEILGIIHNS